MRANEYGLTPRLKSLPWTARLFTHLLTRLSTGSLTLTIPDGSAILFGQSGQSPHAELKIFDWRAASLIMRQGDVGFAESLRRGWLDSHDLLALFTLALRNEALTRTINGHQWALIFKRLKHWILRDNSRRGSRRNILSHYDLGNRFYQLWLDESMTYSAALFEGDLSLDLKTAQDRKYDRILDQLEASAGQRILEIGCGWGGFAERAAIRGINVVGLTLSDAQLEFARQRMQRLGLSDFVEIRLQDYRDVSEQFDHIVSIEMFEAVGLLHWPSYFKVLVKACRPSGRIVVQTIDIQDSSFDAYRMGTDFIQQFVFPGGMLPSPSRFAQECERVGLKELNVKSMGLDYAETLKRWAQQFEAHLDMVREQGFDEAFIRIWRMYLAYCEAGFREQRTDVKQWTLTVAS